MTVGDGNYVKGLVHFPYLWFSCRLRGPFLQEVRAHGAALGWHNMVTSLPACTCTSFFIGVSEKLGAEAEEEWEGSWMLWHSFSVCHWVLCFMPRIDVLDKKYHCFMKSILKLLAGLVFFPAFSCKFFVLSNDFTGVFHALMVKFWNSTKVQVRTSSAYRRPVSSSITIAEVFFWEWVQNKIGKKYQVQRSSTVSECSFIPGFDSWHLYGPQRISRIDPWELLSLAQTPKRGAGANIFQSIPIGQPL